MELVMMAQEDSTPWNIPGSSNSPSPSQAVGLMDGRGYFSKTGIVRRKPSRPDAPPTLSKSCSDKLARRQCTSILSSLTSLFISPANAYISTLTIPESQCSATAVHRAFAATGRMKSIRGNSWHGSYAFKLFKINTTSLEFEFSRRSPSSIATSVVPSNLAAVWTPDHDESLIGGVLQGRKQFDPNGASMVSKRRMWQLAVEIAEMLPECDIWSTTLKAESYLQVKESSILAARRDVKRDVGITLDGWIRNASGESFTL